ncbi:ABC transporter substrate-binding protein [Sphaerimonospora sp. CA-214678]|uniref:ABC transporter substrate-binding protein n=1 Tax=Sphaerimonospora sp. CA-214678 TaxID=3240029 RepID=UPI003D8F5BA5
MRSRLRLGTAGLLAGVLLVTGCGSSSDTPEGESPPSSAAEAGGTIRVGVNSLPPGKGDPYKGIGSPEVYTHAAMFDALTLVDQHGKVQPALATEWSQPSADTWQFKLRDGVTFSNGEKFDADVVVATYDYLLKDPEGSASVVAADVNTVSDVKAVDPLTVEFTTAAPDAMLPARVGEVYIPAPKHFKDLGMKEFANDPVGTGPFKVDSWDSNIIKLSAFEGSWRAPKASKMEIHALPDPAGRFQALQSDQIDLAIQLSPDQSKQLDETRAKADVVAGAQVMSLAFITELGDSPLKKKEVRQALNYAVDKESMAKDLLLGVGKPSGSGVTDGAVGYNPDVQPYPYDPAKAKQMLADAGYPNGFSLKADVTVGSFPADAQIYQLMQQNLADIGVEIELRQITFAEWLEHYLKNTWTSQAFGLSWNTLPRLDALRPMELFSCVKKPAFFCEQSVADVLGKAAKTGEMEERNKLLSQAQQMQHDDPPALYLVQQIDINGVSSKLQGFENINRTFPYHLMSVS